MGEKRHQKCVRRQQRKAKKAKKLRRKRAKPEFRASVSEEAVINRYEAYLLSAQATGREIVRRQVEEQVAELTRRTFGDQSPVVALAPRFSVTQSFRRANRWRGVRVMWSKEGF